MVLRPGSKDISLHFRNRAAAAFGSTLQSLHQRAAARLVAAGLSSALFSTISTYNDIRHDNLLCIFREHD
jgi:hypothetical protein